MKITTTSGVALGPFCSSFIFLLIVISELFKYLHVLCCGILLKTLTAIMHYIDLPILVNDVLMIERSMRVEYERLNFELWLIEPELSLIYKAPTVYEDQTAHLNNCH